MPRPRKPIDDSNVRRLAQRQCSNREIAAVVGVNHLTIARRYGPQLDDWRHEGVSKLRDVLYDLAMMGNPKMVEIALDRYIGPVQKKISIDLKDLTPIQKREFLHALVMDPELDAPDEPVLLGSGQG